MQRLLNVNKDESLFFICKPMVVNLMMRCSSRRNMAIDNRSNYSLSISLWKCKRSTTTTNGPPITHHQSDLKLITNQISSIDLDLEDILGFLLIVAGINKPEIYTTVQKLEGNPEELCVF